MNRWHARPRNWLIVAAFCTGFVCAAVWPLLTAYALGTIVAVCALWFGTRKLLTERRPAPAAEPAPAEQPSVCCCVCGGPKTVYENCNGLLFCWPCADCSCDQTPCVRTGIHDPTVSSEAADRARRVRVGGALREYLKANTAPPLRDQFGQTLPSLFSATEYDLADVAIAELAPELEALARVRKARDRIAHADPRNDAIWALDELDAALDNPAAEGGNR
ncbi:hypothetical protein [Actinacidiphila rubida]|uniref:Uncharacterized protein n=1 Tax=Actinacidiphila rubida TaxID=310780 RepID=A0A1H8SY30_9ACTN|nr:hypothetical protein [Actinacidiphila rubida]SEO83224.1 hypothetical protein SAMN05216267_104632 [Actinacidiphila rubida]